jgi:NAD(P)-dependent dehydrogenase (short-subunit alcohol dehydrogenase family)
MRVAIVTGGSKGFGRALTAGLLREGWAVVTDARHPDELDAAARQLTATGTGTLVAVAGDITDPRHQAALVEAAAQLGPLELVVNNAGGLGPSPLPSLADYPSAALDELLHLNVVAPLELLQQALPALRAHRGAVINVTSDAAVEGYEGWGGYGATKAALEQLSRVLAAEESDVTIYWVDPGDMRTDMHQDAFPGEDISDRPLPEESVPGVLRLLADRPASGRYQAKALAGAPR